MAGFYVRNKTIYVQGSVDGKYYRISTKKEANPMNLKWIKKNHREVLLQLIDKQKPEITEHFKEFAIQSLQNNSFSRSNATNRDYQSIFQKHILPYFKHFLLKDFKPSHLKQWQMQLLDKGLSPKRVKNIRIVLSTIFNDARMDEIILSNPLELVKAPKIEQTQVHPFSLNEVEMLLNEADLWMYQFLTVAFFTGARTGELLALQWNDINFEENTIHIQRGMRQGVIKSTKTGKSRTIDMLYPVKEVLQTMDTTKSEFVFLNSYNKPYTESGFIIKTKWKPLLEKCSLEYRNLYQTRHSFASIMLQKNEDIAWISQMLGHSDISTTLRYYAKFIKNSKIKRASFLNDFMKKTR